MSKTQAAQVLKDMIAERLTDLRGPDPIRAATYQRIARGAIDRMHTGAVARLVRHVSDFRFYATLEELKQGTAQEHQENLGGGYDPMTGILHLDGGSSVVEMEQIYLHEFAEAIDGPNRDVSTTSEWAQAWQEEIFSTGALSKYARTDQHEGFCEFGRLVLSGFSPQRIEAQFPQPIAVWRTHGLVP